MPREHKKRNPMRMIQPEPSASSACSPCISTPSTDEMEANLIGCGQPETHFAEMAKFARELERELVSVILQRDTARATLRDMTKRHFDDQVAADARWNKLRDQREEARHILENIDEIFHTMTPLYCAHPTMDNQNRK